jgi:hypothetical protein
LSHNIVSVALAAMFSYLLSGVVLLVLPSGSIGIVRKGEGMASEVLGVESDGEKLFTLHASAVLLMWIRAARHGAWFFFSPKLTALVWSVGDVVLLHLLHAR